MTGYDAIVLAGGEGSRLGGVSKAEVLVGGRPLLDHVLEAVPGARQVVVVGPDHLARQGVPTVLEDPPLGGPVAGIDAGLRHLDAAGGDADLVLVLACDVPLVAAAVPRLLAALDAEPTADGAHLVDASGHAQIVAVLRRSALAAALAGLAADGGAHGVSMRRLVGGLRMVQVADQDGQGADADTWDDVRRLDSLMPRRATMSDSSPHTPSGSELHRWLVSAGADLGVNPDALEVESLLDLSREVANGVARPAVPLTSFLVGYAVGAGGGDRVAFDRVVARVTELARQWAVDRAADEPAGEPAADGGAQ